MLFFFLFFFYGHPESTPPKESPDRSLLAAFWFPDSVQLTLSCVGGRVGLRWLVWSFSLLWAPSWVSRKKKGGEWGGRQGGRRGWLCTRTSNGFYSLLCSIYHSHTQVQERAKPGIGIRSELLATWKKAPPWLRRFISSPGLARSGLDSDRCAFLIEPTQVHIASVQRRARFHPIAAAFSLKNRDPQNRWAQSQHKCPLSQISSVKWIANNNPRMYTSTRACGVWEAPGRGPSSRLPQLGGCLNRGFNTGRKMQELIQQGFIKKKRKKAD